MNPQTQPLNTDPNRLANANESADYRRQPEPAGTMSREFIDSRDPRFAASLEAARRTTDPARVPELSENETAHVRFIMEKYFANEKPVMPVLLDPAAKPEFEPMLDAQGRQIFDSVTGNPVFKPKYMPS